jgi:hypothetical protein
VDNASQDDSVAEVRRLFPQVRLLVNPTNTGFAAGNNQGIRASKGEYILTLNPDTIVYPKTIETVLHYLDKHPKVGAATCRVELPDGSLDYSCHRGFPTPLGALLHFIGLSRWSAYTRRAFPATIHPIDALTGAFALIRRQVGDQVGWFDEDYFFNGEDLDLCYKIKQAGYKIMYLPDVKITHFKGSSAKATPASRYKWALDSTAVMELFFRKHLAQKYPFFVNWLVHLGIRLLKIKRLYESSS